ncbi:FAD binding domain-containing protein [Pacificimonas sp. WHA3]|uniref:FAD binding domain-containing protein n=1 Tax=Pacificimonas pallii TaxID=2827236 RepID=A0ABS6SCR7_9SPHN|nr:FAD binding domain-containing protein [Pacificimonas pallii]MBV7256035.1 FAD binding domain-containing protein [Pacificimonas pallii]
MNIVKPASVADAVSAAKAVAGSGGDVAYLAGGHTLIPAMKARLRDPEQLVDLAALDDLRGIIEADGRLWMGAMTRHRDVAEQAGRIPALTEMALLIGDPQVRNRGTLGGALANNDPAADYPAAALALEAVIETDRASHAAADFFQGMFFTALEDGELIRRVGFRIPKRAAYAKFRHPASRYALSGVFVAELDEGIWRVAVTGCGQEGVFRWPEAEEALATGTDIASVTPPAASLMSSDIHASAEYRAHLCTVMLAQAAQGLQ